MDVYHALIELTGPDDLHGRATVEAASLAEAQRMLEERFGAGKVVSLWGEKARRRTR